MTPLTTLAALLASADANRPDPMGGQALIEGVLMRSKTSLSAAVRRANGELTTRVEPYRPLRERYKPLKLPILRGAIGLFESLVIGMRYLTWSADVAEADAKGDGAAPAATSGRAQAVNLLTILVSLLFGVALFMYLPILVAGLLVGKDANPLAFNLLAGAIRITLFIGYIWGTTLLKDLRRVYAYHGAEHKAILAYEAGHGADAVAARAFPTLHPRCGTSFLLIAGLACMVIFAGIDALYVLKFGPYPSGLRRLVVHLLLVPIVSGLSFELLRLSDRYRRIPLVGLFILPGLWLQKLTTREPDDPQLETAVVSLKNVLT